ncbi:MAG: hypothetical protein LQ349_002824 [Xanthoria aureola]|nr:MAG: hypothetical protein LQ349_002824 [Xanthoria aureola]
MRLTSLLFASGLIQLTFAAYSVKDDYSTNRFLDMFNFDTFDDPTHGYVNYVDRATADSQDLYNVSNGQVTWGVDHVNVASGRGRNSIRLTSKAQYTHGLVILDLAHMPGGACGVWPAFGEIDIIEGVNHQAQNQITMHTGPGCTLAGSSCEGGLGCSTKPERSNSYGTALNTAGGGVYAMEWTSAAINIWFFPRTGIPGDISSANPNPNPAAWGPATASFLGGDNCNIDRHFQSNNIVFDTSFCGDWAGGVWAQESTCAAQAATCQDYVRLHPEAFVEAYWTISSLKVYRDTPDDNSPAVAVVVEKDNVPAEESSVAAMKAAAPVVRSVPMDRAMVHRERVSADGGNGNMANITEVDDGKPLHWGTLAVGADTDTDADAKGVPLPEGPRGKKISRHSHRHRHVHHPQHRS